MHVDVLSSAFGPLLSKVLTDAGFEARAVTQESLLQGAAAPDVLLLDPLEYSDDVAGFCSSTRGGKIKLVQLLTAGYDRLRDRWPAAPVANAGDAYAPAVAEHALTLALALSRKLPTAWSSQADRAWPGQLVSTQVAGLSGAAAVVVGYGPIGQAIASLCQAFGMTVTAASRRPGAGAHGIVTVSMSDLAAQLGTADVVFLALPLNDQSRRLVNADFLGHLRADAILVNVSRGELVDQDALHDALCSGRIGGAGLDVAFPEPLPSDDRLWQAPNLLITPHIAARSRNTVRRVIQLVVENLRAIAAGQTPKHLVSHQQP